MRIRHQHTKIHNIHIITMVSFASVLAVVGVILLLMVRAATLVTSVEPESSPTKTGVSVIDNAAASGGKAIRFGSQSVAGLRTVAQWESLFQGAWASSDSEYTPASTSGDSWDLYNLSYAVDGNTAMFRASGKTQYLDRSLKYVNNAIASAKVSSTLPKSQYKDSYRTWVNHSHPQLGDDGMEYPLYESYMWRYVADLLIAIKENPTVYANATYRSQYDAILAFTEVNIFDKWYNRDVDDNIYRQNMHMAAHWALIAEALSKMTADATRRQRVQTVVNDINNHLPNYGNNSMRGQLQAGANDSYFWNENWGDFSHPGHDVSHANGFLAYVVASNAMGGSWTTTDLQKFSRTLDGIVWKTNGQYGDFVDGSGSGNGWFNDGFIKLGRVNAALQKRLETHDVGRNIQLYGNGALNAKLLGVN